MKHSWPKMTLMLLLLFLLILFFLVGCQSKISSAVITPSNLGSDLTISIFDNGGIPVYQWYPKNRLENTVRVYIEGDGRAWRRKNQPSSDPTPVNQVVYRLILNDDYHDIAYLSQPCQYQMNEYCNNRVWTMNRYSGEVLQVMSSALDDMKANTGYKNLELIGYSGGGAMALLLAAIRDDVNSVFTVAGNLSPSYLNKHHGVTALPYALEPAVFSTRLEKIPQIHFIGSEDVIVPDAVSHHYLSPFRNKQCIQVKTINADHGSGWSRLWPKLIQQKPECRL